MKLENDLTLDHQVAELMGRVETLEKSEKTSDKEGSNPAVTGDKGPVGDKGPEGDKGPVGDKGPAGEPGSFDDSELKGLISNLRDRLLNVERKIAGDNL